MSQLYNLQLVPVMLQLCLFLALLQTPLMMVL
jgi:hypothetical protein